MNNSMFKQLYVKKCAEIHIEPLQKVLQLADSAAVLMLGELTMGTKNAIAIAHALQEICCFEEIDLGESYMGDEGFYCRRVNFWQGAHLFAAH